MTPAYFYKCAGISMLWNPVFISNAENTLHPYNISNVAALSTVGWPDDAKRVLILTKLAHALYSYND